MANALEMGLRRAAYGAAATAKVGWYGAHYVAGRRIVAETNGEGRKAARTVPPGLAELRSSMQALFRREAEDVARGIYAMPAEFRRPQSPLKALRRSRDYFRDVRAVAERSKSKAGGVEVRQKKQDGLPGYYQQNFHFQTDGWLSEGSAAIYDTQVETLFTGAADAMRRRALPFLRRHVERLEAEGRAREDVVLADVGCGTGRLLAEVQDNFPELQKHAVDLSRHYLNAARENAGRQRIAYSLAPAERLPFADGSVDVLCTVYLFHELPPKIRRQAAAEFARVLRPGGLYLHLDSIQYGDTGLDGVLESFPRVFHEPYYDGYCREDLSALFGEAGMTFAGEELAFLTKVSAFERP